MSSVRALSALARARVSFHTTASRGIHTSQTAHERKSLFGWFGANEQSPEATNTPTTETQVNATAPAAPSAQLASSLFAASPAPITNAAAEPTKTVPQSRRDSSPEPSATKKKARHSSPAPPKRKLSPEERNERFEALLKHVGDRIGAQPAVKDALQIRKTAWSRLLELATTQEQLERVVELMPRWRQMQRDFLPSTVVTLQTRAEQLGCAPLALKVYLDYPQYGMTVPSLSAAHALIDAVTRPEYSPDRNTLSQLVALVAVMRAQQRPALASALGPAASFMAALVNPDMKSPSSLKVFRAMLPGLKSLVLAAPHAPDNSTRAGREAHAQLSRALRAVQAQLSADGVQDVLWLWEYRATRDLHRDPETGRYDAHPLAAQRKNEFLAQRKTYLADRDAVIAQTKEQGDDLLVYTLPVEVGPRMNLGALSEQGWVKAGTLQGTEREEAVARTQWILRVRKMNERKAKNAAAAAQATKAPVVEIPL